MHILKKQLVLVFSVFVLFLIPENAIAQNYRISLLKGKISYNNDDFAKSIKHYKNALLKKSNSVKANTRLGTIYLFEYEQYDSSTVYLKNALTYTKKDTNSTVLFSYARSLRLQEKPKEALVYFEQFMRTYPDTTNAEDNFILIEAKKEMGYCEQALLRPESDLIEVENIGFYINSLESEYTPVFIKESNTLIYNARYKDSKKEAQFEDKQYMENLYYFDLEESVSTTFDPEADQKYHQAIVGIVDNSDSLIIFSKNKLWITSLEERRIGDLKSLPEELTNFDFQPHGVFYNNNNAIIFSAAVKKGDNLDLYVAHKIADGKWSEPALLSSTINTIYNEDSPFLSLDEKTLFFSSKGHNSTGGYDVFKSELVDGEWQEPIALAAPINSAGDDIYFVLKEDGINGFLSSNRNKGFGLMDIYTVSLFPTPKFDCAPFVNPELIANLDAKNFVKPSLVPHKFIWTFEDGQVFEGEALTKIFTYPGEQHIKLDIIQLPTDKVERKEITEIIELNGNNYIGFKSPATTQVDSKTVFDGSFNSIDNTEFLEYFWSVNNVPVGNREEVLNYVFADTGTYTIKMQVDALTDETLFNTYCYEASIRVMDKKESESTYVDGFVKTVITQKANDTLISQKVNRDKSTPYKDGKEIEKLLTKKDSVEFDPIYSNKDGKEIEKLLTKKDSVEFDPIYFNFDKYSLTRESRDELDNILAYLTKYPNRNIIIYGHTDAIGSESYNLNLSKKRAEQAVSYLTAKGLNEGRIIKTVSMGKSQPAEANILPNGADNVEGRRLNRRVEFVIIF